MDIKHRVMWALSVVLLMVVIYVAVTTRPKPGICPRDPKCAGVLSTLRAEAAKYPDINPDAMTNSIAGGVVRNCTDSDVSKCAGFLPYVCSAGGARDFCSKARPAPDWCSNAAAGPPGGAYGVLCSAIRKAV